MFGPLERRLVQRIPAKSAPCRLAGAVASVSFDDFPRSAWRRGGPILERRGVRATYYACGGADAAGLDAETRWRDVDLRELAEAGHEVGCHSFSHVPARTRTQAEFFADLDLNRTALSQVLGRPAELRTHAYPFGAADLAVKRWAAGRFEAARGVMSGINAGTLDLSQLRAVELSVRKHRPGRLERLISAAIRRRGWIIFFTHEIDEASGPYGATPAMLEEALSRLSDAGVPVLPVAEALELATASRAAAPRASGRDLARLSASEASVS